MFVKQWMVPAVVLLLVGCATKNEVTVTGNDPSSIQSSPAGVSTTAFMDIEGGIGYPVNAMPRKIDLPGGGASAIQMSALPNCVIPSTPSSDTVLLTFGSGCVGVNGWDLSGTLTYTATGAGITDVIYDLSLKDPATHNSWTYKGTKQVTTSTTSATVSVSPGNFLVATYVDTSDAAKNKTYRYIPNLHADWTGAFKIYGSYSFQQTQPTGDTITAEVAATNPLTWLSGCCYPSSGTITLNIGSSKAEAIFGPTCGVIDINSNIIQLATCN